MDDKKIKDQPWWQPALIMFTRLSAWVGIPVIIATFIGNWLDDKYRIAPWGLLSTVGVAFVISMAGLVLEAGKEYKRLTGEPKDGKNKKDINNKK